MWVCPGPQTNSQHSGHLPSWRPLSNTPSVCTAVAQQGYAVTTAPIIHSNVISSDLTCGFCSGPSIPFHGWVSFRLSDGDSSLGLSMLLMTLTASRGLVGSTVDVPLFGIFIFTWRRVSCSFLAVLSRVSATSTASLSLWMVPDVSWLKKCPFGFPTAKRCPHRNSEEHYGTLHHRVQPTLKEWRFMFPVHINYLAFYPRDWPALSYSFSNLVGALWVMGIY